MSHNLTKLNITETCLSHIHGGIVSNFEGVLTIVCWFTYIILIQHEVKITKYIFTNRNTINKNSHHICLFVFHFSPQWILPAFVTFLALYFIWCWFCRMLAELFEYHCNLLDYSLVFNQSNAKSSSSKMLSRVNGLGTSSNPSLVTVY